MVNIESRKKEFLDICKKYIKRPGIDAFLNWLENETDFFVAPASTRFHGSYKGGLLDHSLNVYYAFKNDIKQVYNIPISDETIAIITLFHDTCKANLYAVSTRNVKNESGVWEKVPYYTTDDQFPIGHGEKSVIQIMKYMQLTDDEIVAIRWHMSGFDSAAKGGDYGLSSAYNKYPIAVMLHLSDMVATYLMEERIGS